MPPKKPFLVGDRVRLMADFANQYKICLQDTFIVTYVGYPDTIEEWCFDAVKTREYTGQIGSKDRWFCRHFKIDKVSNEDRMRIRKEQLANG